MCRHMFLALKRLSVVSVVLLIWVGCGGSVKTSNMSGFLRNYSDFKKVPDREALYYLNPNKSIADYDKLMFDPVVVYFHPGAGGKGIDPKKLAELTDFYQDEMIKAVEDAYPVVEAPGPGVLRIRAAITDVNVSSPIKNIAFNIVVAPVAIDVGGASTEVEMLDSQTNERILGFVETRKGRAIFNMKNLITRYGDVKGTLKYWAEGLRKYLDEVHETGSSK